MCLQHRFTHRIDVSFRFPRPLNAEQDNAQIVEMDSFLTSDSLGPWGNTDEAQHIMNLVEQRKAYRENRQFQEADKIRVELAYNQKVFFTESDNDRWIKIDTSWKDNQSKTCNVWSHRKRSFCKRKVVNQSNENFELSTSNVCENFFCRICIDKHGLVGRIPCPLDPRHTCLLTKIPSHLRYCQSKPGNNHINNHNNKCKKSKRVEPLEINVNNLILDTGITPDEIVEASNDMRVLFAVTKRMVLVLNDICPGIFEELQLMHDPATEMDACNYIHEVCQSLPKLPMEYFLDDELKNIVKSKSIAKSKQKHYFQQASIAQHTMATNEHFEGIHKDEEFTLVEYCSGKGGLSKMVLDIYEKLDLDHFTSVILIDRINSRKDVLNSPWMISATKKLDTIRINDDIANVDLKVHLKNENSCAVGKHLCGAATDLSLKSYCTTVQEEVGAQNTAITPKTRGSISFAMCCHHLCTFETFISKHTLQKHGIEQGEFLLLRRMVTKCRCHPQVVETLNAHKAMAKAEVGILAKRMFNECRASWLKKQRGWSNVRLAKYVPEEITPENTILVGRYIR